ncbi:G5 domain-containing protein, partial [Facklamia languida]
TEITEEITYERGKEVSRKTTKEEVIDEGTAEIKYIGTKRVETKKITEPLSYKTERRENPDLYEGTERVIQEGKEGSVTKEYEIIYVKGEKTGQTEPREVERVEPVLEIIEVGTKKDQLVEWTVDYGTPEPSEEALANATETSAVIKKEVDEISDLFESGLKSMIKRAPSQSTKDFYQKYLDASRADDGQTVVADFLDYYRKSKDDRTLTLEDLVKDSKGKTGSIYETMILAAAEKLGVTTIEPGQDKEIYKFLMGMQMTSPADGKNLFKDVMINGDFGAYAPRQDAIDSVNEDFDNIKSLLDHWQESFKTITNDETITREETLARILDYYRQVSPHSQATLREAIEDLANYSFSKDGMKAMVNHYDSTLEPLSDIEAYKKVMTITKQGETKESNLNFFTDTVLEILNNLGIPAN